MSDCKKKIVGLIGWPVSHSLSPKMHNTAFRHLGLDFSYRLFPTKPKNLKKTIEMIRSKKIKGANVTIPYKEKIIKYLDKIDKKAGMLGAVNTILNIEGKLIGHNTDVDGFITSLRKEGNFNPQGKTVFLIGCGGVGKAIAVTLAKSKIKNIFLLDKDIKKSKELYSLIRANERIPVSMIFPENKGRIKKAISNSELLINATPVGMKKAKHVINPKFLHKNLFVYDVVYNRKTELLKEAKKRKLRCLGGLEMLIYQGAKAFEIWTGKKAPIDVMRKALI